MAGPLALFRRYQKTLIAIIGVMLMITFVVSSNQSGCTDRRVVGDPVVFHTHQGAMRERELANLIQARRMAHQFLLNVINVAVNNLRRDRTMQAIPPEQIGQFLSRLIAGEGIDLRREISEESFVKSLIIARKAEELGIVITDQSINEFLKASSMNRVTPEQFREINMMMKFSQASLFNALRLELLSARLQRMYFGINAIRGTPPGMRWDYFERLNNRASIQAMALAVDGFLAKVGQPDDRQLQVLYDEHKNDYAIPGLPEPGFHEPEKGKFQYFKADYEQFAKKIEVAQADILDYYEKNKQAMFPYRGFSKSAPPEPNAAEKAGEPEAGSTPPAAPPAGEPDSKGTTAEEASQEPAPETAAPAATEQPPATAPSSDEPSSPNGAGGDDAGGQQATSTAGDAAGSKEEQAVQTEQPAAADKAADPPAAAAEPEAGKSPPPGTPAGTDAVVSNLTIEPDLNLLLPESILAGPNPDFEPLWWVEESIRDTLRRERANAQIREAFRSLAEVVDEYGSAYADYQQSVEEAGGKGTSQPPSPPDFAKVGAAAGVTFHTTKMLSIFDAADTELGKSFINGNESFVRAAFGELRLRVPRQSAGIDGNQFLFWKIDERADVVPSFEEAREAVTRAWRLEQARQLAIKQAGELAAEVNSSGKTLKELYGDAGSYQVIETGEFTWMSESTALSPDFLPNPPEITKVEGIESPGQEFMQAVFDLEPKQAAAAFNEPQTVAYVVQRINSTPDTEVLREQFLAATFDSYLSAASADEQQVARDWMAQLEKEAGLVWERPPDQRLR